LGQRHSVHQPRPDGSGYRSRDRVPADSATEVNATGIARHYGLAPVDYVAVREAHEEAIGTMANAFGGTIGEQTKAMHF
jgi:hypothetical protein